MTRDDIIRMAIDAIGGDMNGQDVQHLVWRLENFDTDVYEFGPDALLKFAALVAAHEREAMIADGWRQCAKGQRTTQFCGQAEQARLKEREECAKVCDSFYESWIGIQGRYEFMGEGAEECASAIRARGQS